MYRHFSTTTQVLKRSPLSLKVPSPTSDVPDVPTFLNIIGRSCSEYADSFPSWESLFTTSSKDMKTAGIDVPARRYILEQVERFRKDPSNTSISEIKLHPKKNGGERKLNQYLSKKRILERIQIAQSLKQFRKSQKLIDQNYIRFDKLHTQLGHNL